MKFIFNKIEGDKAIWAVVLLMALLSFMPIYSTSTNLVYVLKTGTTINHLIKHIVLMFFGLMIIYGVHKIPYRYFSGGSMLLIPIVIILLCLTLAQGTTIGGSAASRWITIPILGLGFQTSIFAGVVLMVYVARYLAKNKEKEITLKDSILTLWLPAALIIGLILPANLSTAALLFFMVCVLCIIGGYPIKSLGVILGAGMAFLIFFILVAKAFPNSMPHRVDTWSSRVDNFFTAQKEEGYQVEKAKIAIATGRIAGVGAGKSVQKNFLPQSTSDFIFAIIVEEYGLILGAFTVMLCYLFLLLRILIAAKKAETVFGTLMVIGVGLPIIFQALVNMGVAVNLFPVTGQTLPLISSGGTSVWMTCLAIGLILSVTANKEKESTTINKVENPIDILHEAIG